MWSTTRPILWESGAPPSGSGSPEASPSSAEDRSSRQPTLVLLAQVSHDPLPGDLHSVVVAHVLLEPCAPARLPFPPLNDAPAHKSTAWAPRPTPSRRHGIGRAPGGSPRPSGGPCPAIGG